MKEPQKRFIGQRARRQDRLIRERVHDPYKTRLKLSEPSFAQNVGLSGQRDAGNGRRNSEKTLAKNSVRPATGSMIKSRR